MKNEIEVLEVNGFELLYEAETQRNLEQEIEVKIDEDIYILSLNISAYYSEYDLVIEETDLPYWELEDIDIEFLTAYNVENEEVDFSKELINDVETYLEFHFKN